MSSTFISHTGALKWRLYSGGVIRASPSLHDHTLTFTTTSKEYEDNRKHALVGNSENGSGSSSTDVSGSGSIGGTATTNETPSSQPPSSSSSSSEGSEPTKDPRHHHHHRRRILSEQERHLVGLSGNANNTSTSTSTSTTTNTSPPTVNTTTATAGSGVVGVPVKEVIKVSRLPPLTCSVTLSRIPSLLLSLICTYAFSHSLTPPPIPSYPLTPSHLLLPPCRYPLSTPAATSSPSTPMGNYYGNILSKKGPFPLPWWM